MNLEQATAIVKEFVSGLSDQKICEVLAFAEDGKMDYFYLCNGLLGVISSINLHSNFSDDESGCDKMHYRDLKIEDEMAVRAECAYYYMCDPQEQHFEDIGRMLEARPAIQKDRDRRFVAILHEIIQEREAAQQAEPVEAVCCGSD